MKQIKLSGRETSVLRVINPSAGSTGAEILEHVHMEPEDLLDVLNGLLDAGYIEAIPFTEHVTAESMVQTSFEINPAYMRDLREAIRRS